MVNLLAVAAGDIVTDPQVGDLQIDSAGTIRRGGADRYLVIAVIESSA
jgi:hypothetical protein